MPHLHFGAEDGSCYRRLSGLPGNGRENLHGFHSVDMKGVEPFLLVVDKPNILEPFGQGLKCDQAFQARQMGVQNAPIPNSRALPA